ncbi:hypothetical protein BJF78_25660 [Pseudonocardia sp. CNS-139]|nr:hypothetical protein BJF78_25660 [Pseudonocardia sp. CNS-139]
MGGALVTYTSWRVIFLVSVPLGVVLALLVRLLVDDGRARRVPAPVDVSGIVLLAALLLSAMTSVTALSGTGEPAVRGAVAGGAALVAAGTGWWLLRHARRTPHAVVPLRLLRGRGFGALNGVHLVFGAAALGFAALVPLYAETRYGLVPLAAGGLLAVRAVLMIGTSLMSVMLLRRVAAAAS